MEPVLFKEIQYFRVKGVWAGIIAGMVFSIAVPFFLLFSTNNPNLREFGISLSAILLLEAFILYLVYIVKLETVVTPEGVYYKWAPFFQNYRFVERNKIETAIVDSTPVFNYRWVHIMRVGKGIYFRLTNDKQIFIGSNDINLFEMAVNKMINSK